MSSDTTRMNAWAATHSALTLASGEWTIRDEFASRALAVLCNEQEFTHIWDQDVIADYAYSIADAMLRRRQTPYKPLRTDPEL